MNYEENLTYEWLRNLRKKLISEEAEPIVPKPVQAAPANQCPSEFPLAVSKTTPKWASKWGDFCYNNVPNSNGIIQIDPKWTQANLVDVTIPETNQTIKLNKQIAEIFPKAYAAASQADNGFKPRIGMGESTGRYGPWQPRHAYNDPSRGISGHAWGMAVDFPDVKIEGHDNFVNTLAAKGFAWGKGFDDPMHFYYDVNTAANQPVYTSAPGAEDVYGSETISTGGGGTTVSGYTVPDYIGQGFETFLSNLKTPQNLLKIAGLTENIKQKNNKIFIVKNKSSHKDLNKYFYLLDSMLPYYNKHLQLDQPVKITFVDDDDNASNPLGRTAFYAPEKTSITVFTTGRFIKDILRSLGHELIHHKQHCIDEFQHLETPEGYAHKDKRLRKKEEEAYLFGNMLFRDWEDKYKAKHAKFKRGLK